MSNSIHASHNEFSHAAGSGQESCEKPMSITATFPTRGPAEERTQHPWHPFEPLRHRRCHPPPPFLPTRHAFSCDPMRRSKPALKGRAPGASSLPALHLLGEVNALILPAMTTKA